jgi:hypothetical protein
MKMKWNSFIWFLLIPLALLPSCERKADVEPEEKGPSLRISVAFPRMSATKAELPADDLENAIHSLSIWVFKHDDETPDDNTPIGYLSVPADQLPGAEGGVKEYSIDVDWNFVNTKPNVDVFALANAASIGCELGVNSNWGDLNTAKFGIGDIDRFGISSPVHKVDGDGLPMSAAGMDLKVYGTAPMLKVDAVTLTRAVSRIRMVFCKTKTTGGSGDDINVDKIVFYGNKIPKYEYVFNTTAESSRIVPNDYVEDQYEVSWPTKVNSEEPEELCENDSPESLIYVNQEPSAYQKMLDDAKDNSQLNDLGYTYFRESDQRLMGRIYYTVNGKSRFREFSMALPGDFARNHTWTLYGYFLSGRNLQLALSVQRWEKTDYTVNFSEQAVTITAKLRVDEDSADVTDTGNDKKDVKLISGMPAKCHLTITTPVSGKLLIRPVGPAHLFLINPTLATIDPKTNSGRIDIEIRNNPEVEVDVSSLPVEDTSITLSFMVDYGGREIDADTEAVDIVYRFRL